MDSRRVKVIRLPGCVSLPTYQTAGAAGMDVYAARPVMHPTPEERRPWKVKRATGESQAVFSDAGIWLNPGDRAMIPSGVAMAIPSGFEVQIRSRSGLSWKEWLVVVNAPATIDSDFRGAIGVLLGNLSHRAVHVKPGDRIAQMVLAPVVRARFHEVGELPKTRRGSGGFGSTG